MKLQVVGKTVGTALKQYYSIHVKVLKLNKKYIYMTNYHKLT